ncbi:MAG: CYTH domain-containing protein, partial [Bacilli bacterium]|nr:CYTH domain-containing protein [Bacilli bacterium]
PVKNTLANNGVTIKDLKVFAVLKTTRSDICYKGSLIEIDKSEYNKLEDYEVECEDSSMKIALRNLKDFLKENDVPYKLNTVTKLKRVMDSL